MTEKEMEEATNPFKINLDTNNDGAVSSEELDAGLDKMAEIETEMSEEDHANSGVTMSEEPDVSSDPITDSEPKLDYPSVESLTELIRPSANPNDLGHRQHWSMECSKFADKHDLHFLGFAIKNDEPIFKEKK